MTLNARDDILARLRDRLGRTAENGARGRAAIDDCLASRTRGPQPAFAQAAGADLVVRFVEASRGLSSSVEEVATLADVPQAVARHVAQHALPHRAVCWPEFASLDWRGAGLDIAVRPAGGEDVIGITGCFCAIAETGTLMLCSGAQTPAATSLLPETHIAVVFAGRIVAGMEDAWQCLRDATSEMRWPRAVNFISGPSRTGDIEQTIVLGAHGPARVHVLVVREGGGF